MTLPVHSTLDTAQSSSKRVIYLQAAQLNQSPTPQSTASPAAQPIASPSIQTNQSIEWIKQHPLAGILTIVILFYLGVLSLRPRCLLILPLDKIPKTPVSPEISIPPAIGSFLKYRPRVLDDWVNQRIAQAQEEFYQRRTVGERSIHIPIPVGLSGNKPAIADFSVNDLKAVFSKRNTRLLIVGEGGVGKTSLACQIAKWAMADNKAERLCKHRMLPVLIEEELEAVEGKSPLLEAIARQIKNLRDDEKPVAEELLKQLLEKRRILVIVDHLSEMSEATRKAARLKDSSSPVNALVVTSRLEDVLGKEVTHTTLKPQRVSGKQLSIFMDAYLTQRGKRDLFDDSEYFDALRRLSQIVTDERDVTVLFAKLYAAQMIAIAEGLVAGDLPNTVPDLMLSYINEVNREKDGKLDDDLVQRDLKAIAWECLKHTFKPETAEREQVINCLAALEGEGDAAKESAKKRLKYLEERLALIRIVPPAKAKIRFALDPLAEYLAGLHLVELCGENEQKWRSFLDEARNKSSTLEIRGLLLAVRDCCIAKSDIKVPTFIIEDLAALTNLDLEAFQREQLKRRVYLLISDLTAPEPEYRARAAKDLGRFGAVTPKVVPALIRALKDEVESVRAEAVSALRMLESEAKAAIPALIELLEAEPESNSRTRLQVIFALGKIGSREEEGLHELTQILIKVIESKNEVETIRVEAISALGMLESEAKAAIPALIKSLETEPENNLLTRLQAIFALEKIGSREEAERYELTQTFIKVIENKEEDREVNFTAFWAVGKLGSPIQTVVPIFLDALKNEDRLIRLVSTWAIGKIGSTTREIYKTIVELFEDQNEDVQVRSCAIWTIGKIHPNEQSIVKSLIELLDNKNESYKIRYFAAQALGRFGLTAEVAIPTLVKVLKEEKNHFYSHSAGIGISSPYNPYDIKVQKLLSIFQEINKDQDPTDELQMNDRPVWKATEISFQLLSQQLDQSTDENTKH